MEYLALNTVISTSFRMRFPLLATCLLLNVLSERGVVGTCQMEDKECVFYLKVEQVLTMMSGTDAVFPENGKLYKYDTTNISATEPTSPVNVVQGDGYEPQRIVTVANGTMPGPPIEVYEGQMVRIFVTNHLYNEATSIHWHGLHQKGTPFMDGVAFVTQCPILPGQTFEYKFKAEPKGTFWYHSHIGSQRTNGMFGAFIIREKKEPEMEEKLMLLQDWNHDNSVAVFVKMNVGGFENRKKLQTTDSYDGTHFSRFFMKSGLINGRGRLHKETGGHNGAPLTVFDVTQSKRYRFRVISAGHLYPFRVSVDQHELTVIASDGYDLQPRVVESIVINPGERIDIIINATENVGNYWIRAQTLEVGVDHKAEAILRYNGAGDMDPTTTRRDCTTLNQCVVLNCPFTYFPFLNTKCIRFDDLKSLADDPAPEVKEGKFKEHFLNFAFPGTEHYPGQVNGRAFKKPWVSALTQPNEVTTGCEKKDCGDDKTCYCTYSLDLEYGDTVQMVLMNKGLGTNWNHPVHMHGHSFYVLKMGYAVFNESNGKYIEENSDIQCGGDATINWCNTASWANDTWYGNNIPGLELDNPPRKDTLIIPTGGYAIIRIRADNPGLWFMHCHIEMHQMDGMAMLINEAKARHPKAPKNFPTCSQFVPEDDDDGNGEGDGGDGGDGEKQETQEMMIRSSVFWTVVGCLIGLCALQFIILFCMCLRRCEGSGREKEWTPQGEAPPQINQGFQKDNSKL